MLEGKRLVPDLKRENFEVLEDGVKQTIISFQHTDLPVSIAVVVDNSGSMSRKRPAVNKSALDLIQASNPQDEAFVVNFSDEAFIDQDFTSDVNKLRDGLGHIESRGGTALYDAVVASADKLVADAKRPKQVLILITDGEDNASTLNLEQTIRRVQAAVRAGDLFDRVAVRRRDEPRRGAARAAGAGDAVDRDGRDCVLSQVDRADRSDCGGGGARYSQPVHDRLPLDQADDGAGIPAGAGERRGQGDGQADGADADGVLPGGAGGEERSGGEEVGGWGATGCETSGAEARRKSWRRRELPGCFSVWRCWRVRAWRRAWRGSGRSRAGRWITASNRSGFWS